MNIRGLERAYREDYQIIQIGEKRSCKVTFPYVVVEREARMRGMSIEEFLEKYRAVAYYNDFDGVLYRFEERER